MKKHAILAGVFCVFFVLPIIIVASFIIYMSFRPIDITSLVKPFLPLVIMSEEDTGAPVATVDVQDAQLRWNGLKNGLHVPVSIALKDVSFNVTSTRFPNFIKEADVTFDPIALLNKSLKLRSVTITEAQLALRRDLNKRIGFDFNKPLPIHHHKKNTLLDFSKLKEIHFEKTFINWREERNKTSWQLSDITADLYDVNQQRKQGIVGSASFNLASWNFPGLLLSLNARSLPYEKKTHKIRWSVLTNPVNPASLTSITPQLAAIDVPVSLESTFVFSSSNSTEWLLPDASNILLHFGTGHIHALGSNYRIERGIANLGLSLDFSHQETTPLHLTLPFLSLIITNPSARHNPERNLAFHLDGQITSDDILHPQKIKLQTSAFIPRVEFRDLHQFWPANAAKGGRKWVTNNITAGTAHDLNFALSMDSSHGLKQLKLRKIRGSLNGKHMTVHWLRPIMPLREMEAKLEMNNPNQLLIRYGNGYQPLTQAALEGTDHENIERDPSLFYQDRIEAGPGTMAIVNLNGKTTEGIIRTHLRGDLGNVQKLLSEPRLHLLSRHPLGITQVRGMTDIALDVRLPLSKRATVQHLAIQSHADIHNGYLKNAVAGHAISNAELALDVNKEDIKVAGHGDIEHFPSTIQYFRDFRSEPASKIREKAHLLLHITPENADASGIKLSEIFPKGHSKLAVNYQAFLEHRSDVAFFYDLTDANIVTPFWRKNEGEPASMTTELHLEHGHIKDIDRIKAIGPHLLAEAFLNTKTPGKTDLTIPNFLVGESQGRAKVTFFSPKEGSRVYAGVYAKNLVIPSSPTPANAPPKPLANSFLIKAFTQNSTDKRGKPWTLDLTADQLHYKNTTLGAVKAFAEDNGVHLTKMQFEIREPMPLSVRLMPSGNTRTLHVFIPDLGEFLNDFQLAKNIKGGRLTLDGTLHDDADPAAFDGKLVASPFILQRPPSSVKTASDISLYGWLNSQFSDDNQNFNVNYFNMPLSMKNNVVTIHDATAGNNSLSTTMTGYALLQTDELNCHGTVVPISSINTLPGQIPGLGKLLSPEKNGGLFSITFKVGGTIQKPLLHINPFSLFAPGALRNDIN